MSVFSLLTNTMESMAQNKQAIFVSFLFFNPGLNKMHDTIGNLDMWFQTCISCEVVISKSENFTV